MQELEEYNRNVIVLGSHIDLGIWFDSFRAQERDKIASANIHRKITMKSGARILLVSGPNSREDLWMWKSRLAGLFYNAVYFLPNLDQECIKFGLAMLRGPGELIARWLPSKLYERKLNENYV